jgi:succinate-semialdehyde dehydrogenase/glutarate-semialdehyde dehydrogenase
MLISKNPANGQILKEFETTPQERLPELFRTAREAQQKWAALSIRKRSRYLYQLRETLLDHVDEIADVISQENGKPRFEALVNELLPCVDMLGYFARTAPDKLRNKPLPLGLMKHRRSYLNYWPVGVVAVIAPWNYPFLLPFADIIMALAAGNAVIFKPSEATPWVGVRMQQLFDDSGLAPALLQTVIGDGTLGSAIIDARPDKIFFTGSVPTGKKVMAQAAKHPIPVNLELGGKDAMIVLPDANLDFATSAALWGGFSNSGQVCASTERVLVHERIAEPFTKMLAEKIGKLRPGQDLGSTTLDKQKDVYSRQIVEAVSKGAELVTGGAFNDTRTALQPTLVTGSRIEETEIYKEETFGPVVALTTFKSVAEAIEKANKSPYGLLASVITKNLRMGEQVAKQLEVGTAIVNEVTYTAGLGETPWGGVKESGFGRTHSAEGLLEFVNVRHIHRPRARFFVFKSFWWFPYTPYQQATFRSMFELYRRSWIDRLRAFPHFLWNFAQFWKNEPRL